MRWEELPMASRARLMAAAVRNGYTDIRSIKEAYANYQDQKQTTGNRYDEGGDTNEPKVINLLDTLPIWKALENIDYKVIADPEFTQDKTGAGSIEYFSAEEPEGITYNNGYHRDHPMPGHDVILYDPNTNDEQDIRLDALHIMPKDPTYNTLNLLYREAARDGDVAWTAKQRYEEDVAKYGKNALDAANMTPQQYFDNEADALLRNMLIEGSPDYISSKKYYPYKEKLQQWNAHLMPYIDNIQQYLESGERPTWINIDNYQQSRLLPELTVTNQKAYGGNLFKNGGSKPKQSKRDYYKQQLIIRGLRGAQLEAVLNNMEVESGFNPTAYNKSSGAKGLMQWLGSRKPKSWSEKDQLDYIARTYNQFGGDAWLDKSAYKRFNETTDAKEASYLFRRYWERPEKSSWHATDKFYAKGNKTTFLPDEVNDLVEQVSNLSYSEPKAPVFTEADQRLLDTSALAFYDPKYVDRNDPNYRSALADAVALDESLDTPANNWAKWNAFLSMQSGQSDPVSSYSAIQQKEEPSLYQLFAPQGDDYMYHGLNFAAYGGKMNKFDTGGKYNDTFMKEMGLRWVPADQVQGDYREKVLQHDPNGTYAVDANSNYVPASRMETLWTDYLAKQDQPDIAIDREIELAKQHRANERFNKSVDAASIGLMSIPGLIPVAGTALPLLAPGTVGGTLIGEAAGGMAMGELVNEGSKALTGRGWGENLRQGLENTFGYTPKLWNPYVQGAYDFFTDMTNPFYYNTKPLKNVITAAESGLTTVAENLYPTIRNTYLSYNLNKAPNRIFSNANNSIFPDIYHQSIYTPQNISQTRWLAEDMSAPELSDAAKNAAQKIASNKNATFNIRRDYDLMYRGNEYNAAVHEGRYPREDGSIPETYQQTVQSETENAIRRMANMGIKEHGVILDDIASNIRNNAAKTRINLVNRENSSPTFDNPDTRATTTLNNRNFSSEWIVSDADANPATINIPLFDTSRRYSNILEPVREIRIPFNSEINNRGVMGVDGQWRLNDPYFGDAMWEYDLGRLPSALWDDMQHEAQHAVGQQMIDLSVTHQPKYHGLFDNDGNLLARVENSEYPMGLIEKNTNLGSKNWGKDIGGKADELDAELHAYIAQEQFLHPEQNISNWNSLYEDQKQSIIDNLSKRFDLPITDIENLINNILSMRKMQGY